MILDRTEIVRKIKSGDQYAFESLYRLFYTKLSYFSGQYLPDMDLAHSVVQDVFAELLEKRDTLQRDTNIEAWLFTVLKIRTLSLTSAA